MSAAPPESQTPSDASPYREPVRHAGPINLPPAKRDWWLAGACLTLLAVWMSLKGHHPGGVLVGLALTLGATVGLLGILGDSPLALRGDELQPGDDPARAEAWWQRGGVLVVLFGVLLYVPTAGSFGLWDPWETHYSEVAREILARDDWITLWWAQEGWFMSKPILIFWLSALGMGVGTLFGLRYQADAGPNIQEWFIRLPIVALTIAAMYAVYRAVSSAWGKRAGLLAAMVLGTMPHWFFLAHQAMTDMPFVASLTIAIAMLMLAITTDPSRSVEARVWKVGPWRLRVSFWHLAVGFLLVVTLPQIVYLLTRPVTFGCPADAGDQCQRALALHRLGTLQLPMETFYLGSAGNSGANAVTSIPGSPPWERHGAAVPGMPSVLQGLVWVAVLAWALSGLRRERATQGLYFVLFYLWCAVSTMGKGPAGLAIPGAVALLHYVASGRWSELLRIRLGVGILVFLVVGMPWYVAITGRLGNEFIERFIVHDIINRTVVGVHGDTGSVRYFVWQLGYAMFPWSGLVPAALVGWKAIVPAEATRAQRDVARIGMLWFFTAFVLFSAMVTKFHHYIFPAIPGAAVMVALLLDRMMGPPREDPVTTPRQAFERWRPLAAQLVAVALAVYGAARCAGKASGLTAPGDRATANVPLGVTLILMGAAAWGVAWFLDARESRDAPAPEGRRAAWLGAHLAAGFGAMAVLGAAIAAFVARDMATVRSMPPGSERLIHLFVYNYDRAWPMQHLDYHAPLFGFGAVAAASALLLAVPRLRAFAAKGTVACATVFAAWCLNVYMIQVTPHWSQRPLFERYYALRGARTGGDTRFTHDPIVAHQMNWKGENFYTGNRVVAEECGLKYCTGTTSDFLREQGGQRVFFITEHSRVQGLLTTIRNLGGEGRQVTSERDNNKFVLVDARMGSGTPRPSQAPRWGSDPQSR